MPDQWQRDYEKTAKELAEQARTLGVFTQKFGEQGEEKVYQFGPERAPEGIAETIMAGFEATEKALGISERSSQLEDATRNYREGVSQLERVSWRRLIWADIYAKRGEEVDFEEYQQLTEYNPDAQDRAWFDANVKPMLERQETTDVSQLHQELQQTPTAKMVNVDDLSTQEILKALRTPARIEPPTGLTETEIRDTYKENGIELTPEGEEELEKFHDEHAQLITKWTEHVNNLDKLRKGLEELNLNPSTWERFKQALVRPALVTTEFMDDMWFKHVRSAAAAGLITVSQSKYGKLFAPVPKIFEWGEDIAAEYEKIRDDNVPMWEALGQSWEEWDQNFGIKLLIETVADPTTYFGWGLAMKLSNAVKLPGILGRGLQATGRAEASFIRASEAPFAAFRNFYRNGGYIPKSIPFVGGMKVQVPVSSAQAVRKMGRMFVYNTYDAVYALHGAVRLRKFTPDVLRRTYRESLAGFLKRGADQMSDTKLGELLYRAVRIQPTEDDVQSLLTHMAAKPKDFTINEKTLELMHETIENVVYKVGKKKENMSRLLIHLSNEYGIANNAKTLKKLTTRIDKTIDGNYGKLEKLIGGDDSKAILKNVQDSLMKVESQNAATRLAAKRKGQGIIGELFSTAGHKLSTIYINGIEKQFVLPASRLYLINAAYGPMNAVETIMRSALGNAGVLRAAWRDKDYVRELMDLVTGVKPGMLPLHFAEEAVSAYSVVGVAGESLVGEAGRIPIMTKTISLGGKELRLPKKLTTAINGILEEHGIKKIPQYGNLKDINASWANLTKQMEAASYLKKAVMHLNEYHPKFVAKVNASIDNESLSALKTVSSNDVDAIVNDVRHTLSFKGSTAVRDMAEEIDDIENTLFIKQMDEMLDDYHTIDENVKSIIRREMRVGTDPDTLGRAAKDASAIAQMDHIQQKTKGMMEFFDAEINKPIETIEELNQSVRNAIDYCFYNLAGDIEESNAAMGWLTSQLKNSKKIGQCWEAQRTALTDHIEKTTHQFNRFKKKIDKDIKLLDPESQKHLRNAFRTQKKNLDDLNSVLKEVDEAHNAFFGAAGKKVKADYSLHRNNIHKIWNKYFTGRSKTAHELDSSLLNLSPDDIPTPPKAGKLTINKCAHMMNTTHDGLISQIFKQDTQKLMSKQEFRRLINTRARIIAQNSGGTPSTFGVSDNAIDLVYDQMIRKLGLNVTDPHLFRPIFQQIDDFVTNFKHARTAKAILPEDKTALKTFLNRTADNADNLIADTELQGVRDDVVERTTKWFHVNFTDYGEENIIDAVGRAVFPFWTYESQRFPWLAKTFVQKPGVAGAWGRYMEETEGYIHIPGTSWEINPLRGTIFMGGLRSLFRRDYPEFYDTVPAVSEVFDYVSRFGFYANPGIGLGMAVFGHDLGQPQFGAVLPQFPKTLMGGLMAAAPDSALTKFFKEKIFHEPFAHYLEGVLMRDMGYDDVLINIKRSKDIELTPEEQAAVAEARRKVGFFQMASEQLGMLRLRPEEKKEYQEMMPEWIETITEGAISKKDWEKISKLPEADRREFIEEYAMTPMMYEQLKQFKLYDKWSRNGILPLRPSKDQDMEARQLLFWSQVEDLHDQAYDFGIGDLPSHKEIDERAYRGEITFEEAATMHSEVSKRIGSSVEDMRESEMFKYDLESGIGVPISLEERENYAERNDELPLIFSPATELLHMYYDIKPEEVLDPITHTYELNFDLYYAKIDDLLTSLPANLRDEFVSHIQRNWTPLMKQRWLDTKDYLRAYNSVWSVELAEGGYTEEQQRLISTWYSNPQGSEASRIQAEEMYDDDEKLISHFRRSSSQVKENMRVIDPMLDAKLRFWGKVSTSKTPEAEKLYIQLVSKYRY